MLLLELRKRMKVIKTCNLYLSFFVLGFSMALTGPCLLDLQHMVHTDTQHIALVYTARSVGYVIGAVAGGILLDLIRHKQAVLAGCNFLVVVTMFAIPWSRDVPVLMGLMSVNGFTLGSIETGANVICLQLWGKDSNPYFQAMHFVFGVGGLVAPLVAAPFLEYRAKSHVIDNATSWAEQHHFIGNNTASWAGQPHFISASSNFSSNVTHASDAGHIPQIIYPFYILGVIAALVTVLYVIVCTVSPTEEGHQAETGDNSDRSNAFMLATVFVTFLMFFLVAGTEIGYGQSLFTYAVKGDLHASTTVGSYVTSAFWASFTVSRLVSVFLAMRVSCIAMLIGDVCVVSVSALILLFLMPSEWALWLATVVFGGGVANGYATLMAWVNTHIYITNKISAVTAVGCAVGEMVMPFLMVYFTDTIPQMFAYVVAAGCVLAVVLSLVLNCIFKKGRRIPPQQKEMAFRVSVTEMSPDDKKAYSVTQ